MKISSTPTILFFCAIIIFSCSSFVQGYARDLTPEHIGHYHTLAFEKLGDKFSITKPTNTSDVIRDLTNVLASFCEEDDKYCVQYAKNATIAEFIIAQKGPRELHYPRDFHPDLIQRIQHMFFTIGQLDEFNIDEIVDTLIFLKEDIEGIKKVRESHRQSALIGISVAIESAKLWHAVYYDESHPLNFLVSQIQNNEKKKQIPCDVNNNFELVTSEEDEEKCRKRNLQTITITVELDVIFSDIYAALNFTLVPLKQDPYLVILAPSMALFVIPVTISASAAALFRKIGYFPERTEWLDFFQYDLPAVFTNRSEELIKQLIMWP